MARRSQSGKNSLRVADVLGDRGNSFGKLLKKASLMMQVQELLRGFLEPGLRDRFQVAAIRQNELVLVTPSAAWATQLRMRAPQVLESLRQSGFPDIESVIVRVAPLAGPKSERRSRKPLTPAAEQALQLMHRLAADEED
jgi:hypothetical protein